MCCSYACRACAWCAVIRRRQCPHARTAASDAVSLRSRLTVSASSASSFCSRPGWRCSIKNVFARAQSHASSHSANRVGHCGLSTEDPSSAASAGCPSRSRSAQLGTGRLFGLISWATVGQTVDRLGVRIAVASRDRGRCLGQLRRGVAGRASAVSWSAMRRQQRLGGVRLDPQPYARRARRRTPATRPRLVSGRNDCVVAEGGPDRGHRRQEPLDEVEPGVDVHDPGHGLVHGLVGRAGHRGADDRPAAAERLHRRLGLQCRRRRSSTCSGVVTGRPSTVAVPAPARRRAVRSDLNMPRSLPPVGQVLAQRPDHGRAARSALRARPCRPGSRGSPAPARPVCAAVSCSRPAASCAHSVPLWPPSPSLIARTAQSCGSHAGASAPRPSRLVQLAGAVHLACKSASTVPRRGCCSCRDDLGRAALGAASGRTPRPRSSPGPRRPSGSRRGAPGAGAPAPPAPASASTSSRSSSPASAAVNGGSAAARRFRAGSGTGSQPSRGAAARSRRAISASVPA